MRVGYHSSPGRHKGLNEDSLYADGDLGLFIVADGMGGHNAGEVASKIAIEEIVRSVRYGLEASKEPHERIHEAIIAANEAILEKSLNNAAWAEMGSTVIVAIATEHELVIGHAGDSRAYLIQGDEIQQLTNDHTFVFEWLKEGLITKEQARNHHQRHGLTEVLGVTDDVEEEISFWPWREDTCLLLCSDGLTDILEDEEILKIVEASSEPQQACEALVKEANARGADDDITVILACRA